MSGNESSPAQTDGLGKPPVDTIKTSTTKSHIWTETE